jgi:aspartyl-tRNA synthetase
VSWRDTEAGELRAADVGRIVTLAGWVGRRRDHGGLIFVDLRDHTGICQLVINPERATDAAQTAHDIRNEFVLRAKGEVVARAADAVNEKLPTGEVEVQVDELEILSRSTPLPFQLDDEGVDEPLRLKYRWLDLRRERMQRNLRLSGTVISAIRRRMEELGFVDFWTPSLIKGTPEGARDFLVPVRLQPGNFFALAQSPQVYKQLFVIGGFDRYYQIATCWRDEDLRADRQFEFRQLDVEVAFAEREEVLDVLEQAVVASFEALDREPPARPFARMSWHDVTARYGSDKPDLRFGLEIQDATELTRGSEFGVFAGAEAVRFLTVPQAFSRAELERLEEVAKEWGAKGLAYLVYDETGEVRSPIAKFLSESELRAFGADPGSTVLFAADTPAAASRILGGLRTHLGRELDLVDKGRQAFLWVIDFPLFEWSEDDKRWTFSHHPFTGVMPGHEELIESDPGAAISQAYDLVWNGWELGSGSIRIHDQAVQTRVFRALGLSDAEAEEKFGFLLEALRMGAPPHGGFAMGIDRFVALMADEPNIREVIGFPKVASGSDPLTGAPTPMPEQTLRELGIRVLDSEGAAVKIVPPDRSLQTDARAKPARPDGRRRKPAP